MRFMHVTIKENKDLDDLNHPFMIEIVCGDNFTREQIWNWACNKIWLGFGTDEDRVMNLYTLSTVSREELDIIRDRILEHWDEGEIELDLEYNVLDNDNSNNDDDIEDLI